MHDVMEPTATQEQAEAGALYVQGLLALRAEELEHAIALLSRALALEPAHQGARRNLVRALLAARRFPEALAQANIALTGAEDAELLFARGAALNALGQPAAACAAFDKCVRLCPEHAPAWLGYANASADLDEPEAAEALCRAALRCDPALAEAHASLGFMLTRQGRPSEAIAACDAAIALRPDLAQAHWNRAVATLLGGDLKTGFERYECRKWHPAFQSDFPPLPGPAWDGGAPAGRTILVRAEQGFGDTIQFARYLALIAASGGRPVLVCAPALTRLIESMPGVSAVPPDAPLPAYDAWTDLISLPWLMGTELETIPFPQGYLRAEPAHVQTWQARLPPGPKVGLSFMGNTRHRHDAHRSVPPCLMPERPAGISFVNLQHGLQASSLGLPDLTGWMTDFAETAALIEALDAVITVDTAVAHLAGALGKPTFVLVPAAPDWRWMLHRSDSPWYRSVRLFRQTTPHDWRPVLAEAFQETERLIASAEGNVSPSRP